MEALRLVCLALIAALATGQNPEVAPPPTWPQSGRMPDESADRYVFLTRDRHTVVVLIPEKPEDGMSGPKKIVRVPLWNNSHPLLELSITTAASGGFSYHYTISNGKDGVDPIGAWTLNIPAQSDPSLKVTRPGTANRPRWVGGPNSAVIAKQAIFPAANLGKYFTWFHQDDNLIRPGETLAGFGIESSYRPGLTTAWFSRGKLPQFDQSWPREIFEQLRFIEDRRWRERFVVTVGPMFPPDTPRETIVDAFQSGVERMVKTGWLNPSSPFTAEVVSLMQELTERKRVGEPPVLKARPGTSTERAVAAGLRFSLDIRLPR